MGHWTPTGVEPKDYDDDDESKSKTRVSTIKMNIYMYRPTCTW